MSIKIQELYHPLTLGANTRTAPQEDLKDYAKEQVKAGYDLRIADVDPKKGAKK